MSDSKNSTPRPISDTHRLPVDGGYKPVPMTPTPNQRDRQPAPPNDNKKT